MKKLLNFILVILILILCGIGYLLIPRLYERYQAHKMAREIENIIMPIQKIEVNNKKKQPDNDKSEINRAAQIPLNSDEQMQAKIKKLQKVNSDVIGIVEVQGTRIKEPILQGKDNKYYLKHLISRRRNNLGAVFLDAQNKSDFTDTSSIIYGHRVRSGLMFQDLIKFKKQSFVDKNKTITIHRDGIKSINYEVIATCIVPAYFDYRQIGFRSDEDIRAYYEKIRSQNIVKIPYDTTQLNQNSRFVILSTCDYVYKNARLIVVGVNNL